MKSMLFAVTMLVMGIFALSFSPAGAVTGNSLSTIAGVVQPGVQKIDCPDDCYDQWRWHRRWCDWDDWQCRRHDWWRHEQREREQRERVESWREYCWWHPYHWRCNR